jgi:hypothetical protein
MQKLRIKNKEIEVSKYLTQKELSLFSLTLKGKLTLFLLGYISIGAFQPAGFTAPVNFYVVKYKDKYFISYRQGWWGAFYAPEAMR